MGQESGVTYWVPLAQVLSQGLIQGVLRSSQSPIQGGPISKLTYVSKLRVFTISWKHLFYMGLFLGLLTTWHLASLTAVVLRERTDCVYDPKKLETKFPQLVFGK